MIILQRGDIMHNTYKNWTKNKLVEHILKLENRDADLKKHDETFLVEFPWAGNLGQWQWFYDQNKVVFNHKKVSQLGYNPAVIGDVSFEFFTEKLHPDDYERVMQNMRDHLANITPAYEVEYRILHKDGYYLWYYDRGTVTKRDSNGMPLLLQGIVFDITESKKVEEQLRFLSERDPLTNVYNRRSFFTKLDDVIKDQHINEIPFSLIMFDIDHFKKINDTHGHLIGDDTLRRLTHLINEDKRSNDLVYRYGGEEFFVLLANTKLDGAVQLAKRLHKLIGELKIPKVGHITVSMGVVEYGKDESVDDVIKRVDDLMYDAKEAGRNQIKF